MADFNLSLDCKGVLEVLVTLPTPKTDRMLYSSMVNNNLQKKALNGRSRNL